MPDRPSFWNTLGWGAYLACSWTWCIGMFLPVLLIRDFGWWSFPVFAIPNCVGAAAMGWVMRRPGSSEAVTAAHQKAIRAFSLVTVYFQFYFLFSMILPQTPGVLTPVLCGAIPGILFGTLADRGGSWSLVGSLGTFATSVGLALYFLSHGPQLPPLPARPNDFPALALLAPVCLFGFTLSPYLDGTFHRAARSLGGSIPSQFGAGFLVFFPIMILFTAIYAGSMFGSAAPGSIGTTLPWIASAPVLGHIASQSLFTAGIHMDVFAKGVNRSMPLRMGSVAQVVFAMMPFFPMVAAAIAGRYEGGFEIGYRLFMSFYGLIFPAYVWICMIPTLREPTKPTRRQLTVLSAAILLAAPLYYLGFIQLKYWALAPGVLIPLLARFAIGMPPKPNRDRQGAVTPDVQNA